MSAEDYNPREHYADDCNYERCTYCGCCAHGRTQRDGCKVDAAPAGMLCPGPHDCGCEGRS